MQSYDVAVVGGGPGGYVAAIRAAKEGQRVALIEGDHLGGTCLNRGCIPSKTLLRHAEVIEDIQAAKGWGIETGELTLSLPKMMARKDEVIKRLRMGIASLLKAGKIDHYQGYGTVHADKTIAIAGEKAETIKAKAIILATGSVPFVPPIPGVETVNYHTSDTIFSIEEIPDSIVIIGGGVIGVEFACIFQSLGTDVTIVEMASRLVPHEDADAAAALLKALQQRKVKVLTDSKVEKLESRGDKTIVHVTDKNGQPHELSTNSLLIAVGRKPNLRGIEQLNVAMNGPFVAVNEYMETSLPGIYAVGDLVGGWQLAHVASAEGITAAINAAGGKKSARQHLVPRCIYTSPEIASIGMTVEQAQQAGHKVRVETFPLAHNGKALAMGVRDGFVKLIADETHGEILGAVMVGPHVTEMIAIPSAFIYLEGTVQEMAEMIFPHPNISETLMEAAANWLSKGLPS